MKNIRAVIIVLALLSTGGCSANAAQTSDEPSEESGSGLGQSRWTWEMIHLPSFIPAVDSDAGRAAGENYDTRSIDEMKDLFETERIEEIKK